MTEQQVEAVKQAFGRFKEAMLAANADQIQSLTAQQFTLRHITGYVQRLTDWLHEISLGQFVYYSINLKSVSVTLGPEEAMLLAQTLTDARVYGTRNVWRLQLEMHYALQNGSWIAERAIASTW